MMILRRQEYRAALFDGKSDADIEDKTEEAAERVKQVMKDVDPGSLGMDYYGLIWIDMGWE